MTSAERHAGAAGFSLAEVVVALGLLASILISVAGLLVVGNRQVARGRNSTEALALAREVLEEMKSWSFAQTTEAFSGVSACNLAAPACAIDSISAKADVPDVAKWQDRLDDALNDARVLILLDSLDGAALADARALRVTVVVEWMDGVTPHSLRLATTRM